MSLCELKFSFSFSFSFPHTSTLIFPACLERYTYKLVYVNDFVNSSDVREQLSMCDTEKWRVEM